MRNFRETCVYATLVLRRPVRRRLLPCCFSAYVILAFYEQDKRKALLSNNLIRLCPFRIQDKTTFFCRKYQHFSLPMEAFSVFAGRQHEAILLPQVFVSLDLGHSANTKWNGSKWQRVAIDDFPIASGNTSSAVSSYHIHSNTLTSCITFPANASLVSVLKA